MMLMRYCEQFKKLKWKRLFKYFKFLEHLKKLLENNEDFMILKWGIVARIEICDENV